MMKKYRIANKDRFYATIVILLIFIVGGIYISIQEISSCKAEQKANNAIITTESVIKAEPVIVTPEVIKIKETTIYNIPLDIELQEYTSEQCEKWNIADTLVYALFMRESSFQIYADSGVCYGLGQLSKNTFKNSAYALEIKNPDIFNPKHNIECTVYHLSVLRDSYMERGYSEEDVFYCILGAYNQGSILYDRYAKSHGTIETKYANSILDYKMQLEQYNEITD